MKIALFRLSLIIGTLPVTLTNGTVADATQVMADLNKIVNDVNANAAPLAGVALLAASNTFTMEQFGVSGTTQASFPTISQVQGWTLNTLSSVAGGNTITGSVQGGMAAYPVGGVFTFYPSAPNSGPVTLNVNGIAPAAVHVAGAALVSNTIRTNRAVMVRYDGLGTGFSYLNPPSAFMSVYTSAPQTITAAGALVLQHGLGQTPTLISMRLRCTDAGGEGGYAQNDEVFIAPVSGEPATVGQGISVSPDATNLNLRFGSAVNTFAVNNKGTGATVNITNAKWALIIRAFA